jgi:hypothetical protein
MLAIRACPTPNAHFNFTLIKDLRRPQTTCPKIFFVLPSLVIVTLFPLIVINQINSQIINKLPKIIEFYDNDIVGAYKDTIVCEKPYSPNAL